MRKVISTALILVGTGLAYGVAQATYQMFARHSALFITVLFFVPLLAWWFRPRAIGPFKETTSRSLRAVATAAVASIAIACNYHHLAFERHIADVAGISYESEYNFVDNDGVPNDYAGIPRVLVPIHTDVWWQTLLLYLLRVLVTLVELVIPLLTWQLMGPFVVRAMPSEMPPDGIDRKRKIITRTALAKLQGSIEKEVSTTGWIILDR